MVISTMEVLQLRIKNYNSHNMHLDLISVNGYLNIQGQMDRYKID